MDSALTALVKIERGDLTKQIKNLKQSDWQKACERLNLWVVIGSGRGSHIAVYKEVDCDRANRDNLVITIQKHLTPNIQTDKLKQLIAYGDISKKYTEDDVWRALKILK
jgi:hypothetical protein